METLIEQLTHAQPDSRYEAAQALAQYPHSRTVSALVAVLQDENSKVRYAALSSLVKISDPHAGMGTVQALLVAPESRLWTLLTLDIGMRLRNGLFAMIQPGDTPIADVLLAALDDARFNEQQRALIIRMVGRTMDTRSVDHFVYLLLRSTPTIQAAAAESLGFIGDNRAVKPMLVALKGASSSFREIIINALAQIGDKSAADDLLPMLNSGDEWTRRAAASALAALNEKRAMSPLLKLLQDESEMVQEAADAALQKLIAQQGDDVH